MSDQPTATSPASPAGSTSRSPIPRRRAAFYGGLFGWTFEDVMPPGSPRPLRDRRRPRRRRRRPSAALARRRRGPAWETYVRVADADETAAKVRAAGGTVVLSSRTTSARRADGDLRRSRRRAVLASGRPGRTARRGRRQRARLGELQPAPHARREGRGGVLRRGVRLGAARRRRRLDVGARRRTATSSSGAGRGCASRWRRWARRSGSRTSSRASSAWPATSDRPEHWSVVVRRRRRRRGRPSGRRRSAARCWWSRWTRPWVRMTVISDPQGATFTASKFVPENRELEARA